MASEWTRLQKRGMYDLFRPVTRVDQPQLALKNVVADLRCSAKQLIEFLLPGHSCYLFLLSIDQTHITNVGSNTSKCVCVDCFSFNHNRLKIVRNFT